MANEKRLIDANAVHAKLEKIYSRLIANLERAELAAAIRCVDDLISEAPTVDAVEVVRCRDCKHHSKIYGNRCKKWSSTLSGLTHFTGPDDFCSYGERRSCDD